LRADQQALKRSANAEAVRHLSIGLGLLAPLPDTLARTQQELDFHIALGPTFMATYGQAAPEVEQTYARARALCAQLGETPLLLPTLQGLCRCYRNRGALRTAPELAEQLGQLVQRETTSAPRIDAHEARATTLYFLGEYPAARIHLEQAMALLDPTPQPALVLRHGEAPAVRCHVRIANTLWCLGYPVQAVRHSEQALLLARELDHPYSLAYAQHWAADLYHHRREVSAVHVQAEVLLPLAAAQGDPLWVGFGTYYRGWV
jgi:tetratricopeptide (TPR) repeat protein